MERKALYIGMALITLAVAAGVIFLVIKGEKQDLLGHEGTLEEILPEVNISDGAGENQELRIAMEPEEMAEPEPGAMPVSYREALGGVRGRVLDADGTPLADLKVEVIGGSVLEFFQDIDFYMQEEPGYFELRTDETRTGEDGVFWFHEIYPRAFYALGIDLGGARTTTRILDAMPAPGEMKDLGDIMLEPYAVLFGTVVDDQGAPVSGARVRASQLPPVVFTSGVQDLRKDCSFLVQGGQDKMVIDPPPSMWQLFELMPFPTTTSEGDGTFRLEGVPLGLVSLVVDHPGHVSAQDGPYNTNRGGEKDAGEIVIAHGVGLEGKVVDHLGDPLAGIEVRAGPMYGFSEFIIFQPGTVSNEKGAFRFSGVLPRATYAGARRFEEDPWTIVGPFDPETEPPVITLPPAYDLRLVINRDDGTPAKNVRMKMREKKLMGDFLPFNPPRVPKERVTRPEEGVIDVAGLPKGRFEFLITAPGCGVEKEEVSIKDEPVEKLVILKASYHARVRVMTERGNKPLEWAEVSAALGDEGWFLNPTKLSRARTDDLGLAILKNLAPGEYNLSVSHPGYAVTGGLLKVPAEEDTEVVVLVKDGGVLEGVVHRGGSTHEAPYMVALNNETWQNGPEAMTPRVTCTDLEGNFRVENMNPGNWGVSVLKRLLDQNPLGFGEVMRMGPLLRSEVEIWEGKESFIELNLDEEDTGPSAEVLGKVFIDGKAAEGARLFVRANRRYEAVVDGAGNYSLGKVPVGDYTLRFAEMPYPTGQYDFRISRRINVEEEQPLYEDFALYTGAIAGRVVYDLDGTAVRGIKVEVNMEEKDAPYRVRMNSVTGLDGSFRLDGVPVGIYSVSANDRNFGCKPVTGVKVFPGSSGGSVLLTMIRPVTVAGRVELGEEFADTRWLGMMVQPAEEGSGGRQWVRLDGESGEFETNSLIPGSYKANIYGSMKTSYLPMPFDVPPGGVSNLVLVPEPAPEKD